MKRYITILTTILLTGCSSEHAVNIAKWNAVSARASADAWFNIAFVVAFFFLGIGFVFVMIICGMNWWENRKVFRNTQEKFVDHQIWLRQQKCEHLDNQINDLAAIKGIEHFDSQVKALALVKGGKLWTIR